MSYLYQNKNMSQQIEIVHVVACNHQHCIGINNQLPWHIQEDLQHFKRITERGIVIMGRKTFESIEKALPNRINWVVTRNPDYQAEHIHVAHDLEEVLFGAAQQLCQVEKQSLFIIGGGELFKQSISMVDRIELTRVQIDIAGGDAFYPEVTADFKLTHNQALISKANQIPLIFETYQK